MANTNTNTNTNNEENEEEKQIDQKDNESESEGEGRESKEDVQEPDKEEKSEGDNESEEDGESEESPLDTDTWGTTNTEVGDSVLLLLQNAGMSVEEAKSIIYDPLVKYNDVSKIDRDALVEKLGAAKTTLVMAGIENYMVHARTEADGIIKTVHEAVGGKEVWDTILPWFKENASKEEAEELKSMIDSGGKQAKFAAKEMLEKYNSDPGNTTAGKDGTIEGDSKSGSSAEAIGHIEATERLMEAYRTKQPAEVIQAIRNARTRGRKKGIN